MNKDVPLYKELGISALSALLAALAYAPWNYSFLAWIALMPWLYQLTYLSLKRTILCWLVFDIVYFGVGVWWMATVHILCPVAILIPMFFLILPFPLIFRWTMHHTKIPLCIAAPVIWVADDYLRCYAFTGFPWLYMGHTQAWFPTLIQFSDITGAYGVTFLVVLVNAIGAQWYQTIKEGKSKRSILIYTVITMLLLACVFIYGTVRLKNITYKTGPKVASIQGNIPQDIKDDPLVNQKHILNTYPELSLRALQEKPDLLIWPETMSPSDIRLNPSMWQSFQDLAKKGNVNLLIGSHHRKVDFEQKRYKNYNSAYFLNKKGELKGRYDKIRLVPVGESIPFSSFLPFIPVVVNTLVGYVPDLQVGTRRPVFKMGKYSFGSIVCFDIIYPDEPRILAKKGCQFVVNVTNEGWFAHSAELEQITANSVFRAIENRIGIMRAGNTGITLVIPPTGIIERKHILAVEIDKYWASLAPHMQKRLANKKILAWHHFPELLWRSDASLIMSVAKSWDIEMDGKKLKWKDFPGVFVTKVPLQTGTKTFYTLFGDVFVWLNCLAVIALLFYMGYLRFNNRGK